MVFSVHYHRILPPYNTYAEVLHVSSETRNLNFCLILYLHPSFMYESSEGSGESAHLCGLTGALVDKYKPLSISLARLLLRRMILRRDRTGEQNALNNRRKRTKNRYKQCFRLPFVASETTNGNQKLCF